MKCHDPFAGQQAATRIDLRNSMDFFCMLKTCALIKRLGPGESVHVLANDRNFLDDLRRIHPDCAFETVSCVMGFEEDADYLVRVSRRIPQSENHETGGRHDRHDRNLPLLPGSNVHRPGR